MFFTTVCTFGFFTRVGAVFKCMSFTATEAFNGVGAGFAIVSEFLTFETLGNLGRVIYMVLLDDTSILDIHRVGLGSLLFLL